jgi:hypothetical protein
MKKTLSIMAATLALACTALVAWSDQVPVNVGEGTVTITIPLVVADNTVVIQTITSREKPTTGPGVVSPYCVSVYYPAEWGKPSVQHHWSPSGLGMYTLTFNLEDRSMSFTLDLKRPLANLEKADREKLLPGLEKVLGKEARNLSFSPERWLVEWRPTERQQLRQIAGLDNLEDELITTEKVKLPPQASGQPTFTLEKVEWVWEVSSRTGAVKDNIASLKEVAPFLSGIKDTPIRVKEGFLKLNYIPGYQGSFEAGQGREWLLEKNKTAIKVVLYKEYFVAIKK